MAVRIVLGAGRYELHNASVAIFSLHISELYAFLDAACCSLFSGVEDGVCVRIQRPAIFRIRFHLFDEVVELKSSVRCYETCYNQVVGLWRSGSFRSQSSNNSVDAFGDMEDVENVVAWVPNLGIEVFNSCRVDNF